jgi:hypothetical protein
MIVGGVVACASVTVSGVTESTVYETLFRIPFLIEEHAPSNSMPG